MSLNSGLNGAELLDIELSPSQIAQQFALMDDSEISTAMIPIAARLAESPELAATFIDQIINEAINLGTDLSPILSTLLEHRLNGMQLDSRALENALNNLAADQPQLIEIFRNLDPEVQRQMGALYIYLQINRGISADDYFQISKKLNLPRLPKELWDVRRFGVSNMGKMNTDAPATLDYTVYGSTEEA